MQFLCYMEKLSDESCTCFQWAKFKKWVSILDLENQRWFTGKYIPIPKADEGIYLQ